MQAPALLEATLSPFSLKGTTSSRTQRTAKLCLLALVVCTVFYQKLFMTVSPCHSCDMSFHGLFILSFFREDGGVTTSSASVLAPSSLQLSISPRPAFSLPLKSNSNRSMFQHLIRSKHVSHTVYVVTQSVNILTRCYHSHFTDDSEAHHH